ncbi:proline-rich protein 12-like [Pieris brassicae]|uniref:proline-rich protein 12-like n=1 Tax=Pieris brassicae TaxID=7116 RepID=UPI001E660C36|nr:proline-rich protein 12-like [Pieris brassicae]
MPRVPLLLLVIAAARAADVFLIADTANQTRSLAEALNETVLNATYTDLSDSNDTLTDGDHEPVVRKKRTFSDIVFRGLADVLGYNVARKPPQAFQFPPPLAPIPGIDSPAQAGPAPAPTAPPAPPCASPRAVAPPPCRARPPPAQPKAPPPCAKPRAAAPRARPTQPPARPPPCGTPKANPTTPAPCSPAPQPKADSSLDTINTNFRLNFNFNRALATPSPVGEEVGVADEEVLSEQTPVNPIAIQPRAAKLPPPAPRNPRVYVDAFVLRDGVAQRVHTVDAQNINRAQAADDDYLFYVDDEPTTQQGRQDLYDDYEDIQDSGDRSSALRDVGKAVDQFWMQKPKSKQKLSENDYRRVHFGDRDEGNRLISESDDNSPKTKRTRTKPKRIPTPTDTDLEEESEVTTTTQDPRRKLKPRVLPPTEHNPNQIDTITVRVPPIYKEKRPKKLHRETPEKPDRDENDFEESPREYEEDAESEQSTQIDQTEAPKRKRRRKKTRRVRSTYSKEYSAGDYDYYGRKIPISEEEEHFKTLTVPPPTRDADVARLEDAEDEGNFLDDHERLREDSERIIEKKPSGNHEDESEVSKDDSERSDDNERSDDESERAGETERADESEKTDKLSPNAQVRETGYNNMYVSAHNVRVDRPRPHIARRGTTL